MMHHFNTAQIALLAKPAEACVILCSEPGVMMIAYCSNSMDLVNTEFKPVSVKLDLPGEVFLMTKRL